MGIEKELLDPDTDLSSFRRLVRDWITANFPRSLTGKQAIQYVNNPAAEAGDADYRQWRHAVADLGLGVPSWPVEFGGAGLTSEHASIFAEELARIGAFNPVGGLGVMMLGPTILEFGTPEQKKRYIPPIARGEVRWCQGFSEPGSGSDLASLQTKCEDRGDHWLVNGQKIWTSYAHTADWCFCLVRTDRSVKHAGISFLLIDMTTPGIEARPLQLINGISHFCETFFTDVAVPKENVLGPLNGGWSVAKRLLQHERGGLSARRAQAAGLTELARRYLPSTSGGRVADTDLRSRLTEWEMMNEAYNLTVARRGSEAESGTEPATPISVLKNLGAIVGQKRAELTMEIVGTNGIGMDSGIYSDEELGILSEWLHSKCYSIYGGSHEIQNNITAKIALELPIV